MVLYAPGSLSLVLDVGIYLAPHDRPRPSVAVVSRDRRASEILRRHQEKMRLRANARFLGHMVIQGKTKMGHSYACVEPIYTPGKDLTLKELKFLQMLISGAPVLI